MDAIYSFRFIWRYHTHYKHVPPHTHRMTMKRELKQKHQQKLKENQGKRDGEWWERIHRVCYIYPTVCALARIMQCNDDNDDDVCAKYYAKCVFSVRSSCAITILNKNIYFSNSFLIFFALFPFKFFAHSSLACNRSKLIYPPSRSVCCWRCEQSEKAFFELY